MARVHAGEFFAQGVIVYMCAWGLWCAWKERNFVLLTLYQFILSFCLAVCGCGGIGRCHGMTGEQFILHAAVAQFIIVGIFVFQIWKVWKCVPALAMVAVIGLGLIGLEQMVVDGAAVIALIVLVEVLVLVSGLAAVELVAWFVREGQPLWNDDHRNHEQKAMDKVVVVCGCGGAVWLAVEVV
jgi:hypothetical protein